MAPPYLAGTGTVGAGAAGAAGAVAGSGPRAPLREQGPPLALGLLG